MTQSQPALLAKWPEIMAWLLKKAPPRIVDFSCVFTSRADLARKRDTRKDTVFHLCCDSLSIRVFKGSLAKNLAPAPRLFRAKINTPARCRCVYFRAQPTNYIIVYCDETGTRQLFEMRKITLFVRVKYVSKRVQAIRSASIPN